MWQRPAVGSPRSLHDALPISLTWDLGETRRTVALRMPDHEIALELLRRTGPLAVSSANRHGKAAAQTVLDAATQLGDRSEEHTSELSHVGHLVCRPQLERNKR